MSKMKNVVEYAKTHKKEIATTAIVGTIGVVSGIIGHKMYIHQNHKELSSIISQFGDNIEDGTSMTQTLTKFLDKTTGSVHPMIPRDDLDKKISDMLTPYALSILDEYGIDTNKKISGILIGTVKD